MVYSIICEVAQRDGISSKAEKYSHILCLVLAVMSGLGFVGACEQERSYREFSNGQGVPSRDLYNSMSYYFFGVVSIAIIARGILWNRTQKYAELWKEHNSTRTAMMAVPKVNLEKYCPNCEMEGHVMDECPSPRISNLYLEASIARSELEKAALIRADNGVDDKDNTQLSKTIKAQKHKVPLSQIHVALAAAQTITAQKSSVASAAPTNLVIYSDVIKPLMWYPTLFICFVLPQILITITDNTINYKNPEFNQHEEELARLILHTIIPFRGFCLMLVFKLNNKSYANWQALKHRLLVRYSAYRARKSEKKFATPTFEDPLQEHLLQEPEDLYSSEKCPHNCDRDVCIDCNQEKKVQYSGLNIQLLRDL